MLLDMFPASIKEKLTDLEAYHGPESMARVHRFLADRPEERAARSRLQRGKHLLPGLPGKPWHDLQHYDGLREAARALMAHHSIIQREFFVRAEAEGALVYYGHKQIHKGWMSLYLQEAGALVAENLPYFPRTMECIQAHVRPHLYSLAEVHFSILEPRAHIPPHCDQHNFTLSFHLGVDVPDNCSLRVAGASRRWQTGECLLFDHSFEHEAFNRSDERRVVLIMDVWHPETTPVEREALGMIFQWMLGELGPLPSAG